MSTVSGFDPLFSAFSNQVAAGPGSSRSVFIPDHNLSPKPLARLRRLLGSPSAGHCSPSPFVSGRHELVAASIIEAMVASPHLEVVLSAGENQFGGVLSAAPSSIRSRLHVCFHQPPSWMRLHWRDRSVLDGLGSVVCLCNAQREEFKGLCDSPVIQIAHGVRSDFFKPEAFSKPLGVKLLFVGHWLRDFDCLHKSMTKVWSAMPEAQLDCVIPINKRDHPSLLKLARSGKVRWHAGISAEKLRSLYQNATLLLLPLIDATANNAIVEALSCGLPVISSDVGGIGEYVDAACGSLCIPGSAQDHAAAVLEWLADPLRLEGAAQSCRRFAQTQLDWDSIAADFLCKLAISAG